jgi:hypothetical protein
MNLSPAQIAQYAAAAGFTGNDLLTAVDIALAESNGGNPNAYFSEPQDVPGKYGRVSANDGKGSYGLWQIYLAAHPEFSGVNLLDPQTNANAAYSIYAVAGGFTPWSTYTSGEYGMYESPAVQAAVAPYGAGPAAAAPLTLDASTGQPIAPLSPGEIAAGGYMVPVAGPSLTDVLVWGGLAVIALWAYAEA